LLFLKLSIYRLLYQHEYSFVLLEKLNNPVEN